MGSAKPMRLDLMLLACLCRSLVTCHARQFFGIMGRGLRPLLNCGSALQQKGWSEVGKSTAVQAASRKA